MNPVLTAVVGDNSDLFPNALQLYSKKHDKILDMTWGKGVFWKKVDISYYLLFANDIDPNRGDFHFDFRKTGWDDCVFDGVVLDPPYASRSSNKKSLIGGLYNNNQHHLDTVKDMLAYYYKGMIEAHRLLKPQGVLYVKCQDEVASGKQERNTIAIWRYALEVLGFIDEDAFRLVRESKPMMRHNYQFHARKNDSTLWVFRKPKQWWKKEKKK